VKAGAKLEKAYLRFLQPSGARAPLDDFAFQFNPKEFTVVKSAKWNSDPSAGAPKTTMPQYGGAEPQAMTPDEFARFLRDTHAKLGKVIAAANIKVD